MATESSVFVPQVATMEAVLQQLQLHVADHAKQLQELMASSLQQQVQSAQMQQFQQKHYQQHLLMQQQFAVLQCEFQRERAQSGRERLQPRRKHYPTHDALESLGHFIPTSSDSDASIMGRASRISNKSYSSTRGNGVQLEKSYHSLPTQVPLMCDQPFPNQEDAERCEGALSPIGTNGYARPLSPIGVSGASLAGEAPALLPGGQVSIPFANPQEMQVHPHSEDRLLDDMLTGQMHNLGGMPDSDHASGAHCTPAVEVVRHLDTSAEEQIERYDLAEVHLHEQKVLEDAHVIMERVKSPQSGLDTGHGNGQEKRHQEIPRETSEGAACEQDIEIQSTVDHTPIVEEAAHKKKRRSKQKHKKASLQKGDDAEVDVFLDVPLSPSALFDAIEGREIATGMLIIARPDFKWINSKNPWCCTALHLAASRGLSDMCCAILARSDFKEVNAKSSYGCTALHYAAAKGLSEVCTAILAKPDFKEINFKEENGATVLHKAASKGMADVCMDILKKQDFKEVNAKTSYGLTGLHYAAGKGLTLVCKAILERLDFVAVHAEDADGFTALDFAIRDKHAGVCTAIITSAAFRHVQGSGELDATPLRAAQRTLGPSMFEQLLGLISDEDLHICRQDVVPIVDIQETDGGGAKISGEETFNAQAGNNGDSKKEPLQPGALFQAIADNDPARCVTILQRDDFCEVNAKDSSRCTALHVAASRGMDDICMLILSRNDFSEINALSSYACSALHYAISKNLSEVSVKIVSRADFTCINLRDESGATALHKAAQKGLPDVCIALLAREDFSEINAKNNYGCTALHYAVSKGLTDVCKIIIERPDFAEVHARDSDGFTALELARELRAREAEVSPSGSDI